MYISKGYTSMVFVKLTCVLGVFVLFNSWIPMAKSKRVYHEPRMKFVILLDGYVSIALRVFSLIQQMRLACLN